MNDQITHEELEKKINIVLGDQIDRILSNGKWEEHLKIEISQILNRRLSLALNEIDINSVIESSVKKVAVINQQLARDVYPGIQDNSDSKQIAIMTGAVVVENDFITKNLEVVEDTKLNDTVVFGDLEIKGKIKTNSDTWKELADRVDDFIKNQLPSTWTTDIKNSVIDALRKENPLKDAAPGTKLDANLAELLNRGISTVMSEEIPRILGNKEWEVQIETLLAQVINRKVMMHLQEINFAELIKKHISDTMDSYRASIRNIYPGIDDKSSQKQLTLIPGAVVAEEDFITKNLEVVETAKFNDIEINGRILSASPGWQSLKTDIANTAREYMDSAWNSRLRSELLQDIKNQGVDVSGVSVNGEKVIDGNTLSPKIENSSLRKVGILENLQVSGESKIASVSVFHNRLGINTDSPEMALSIWDEEVSVVVGKKEKNKAFIGTNRPQKIGIGVNGESSLDIDTDGTVTLKKLKVGRNQLGFANEVPGWSGAKGDIVFNTNYTPGSPFAWICLGTFKWSALKNQ